MRPNQTAVLEFTNFRGGYCSDVPIGEMADYELQTAENCYWRDGLTKRKGKAVYASATGTNIRGSIRARIKEVWYTILAVDTTSSGVELRIGTDTAFASLTYPVSATGVTLTTGTQVQFCYLDNKVGVVNGTDKPMVIYQLPSATNVADTIERYDTRNMDDADWVAGNYYVSGTAVYTTYTTEAQSSASNDFPLATISISNGFWVACNHTYNFIRLFDVQGSNTATLGNATVSFTFEYYGRNGSMSASETWVSFAPISTPTWTIAGDKVVELNWPTDPTTGETLAQKHPDSSTTSAIAGRYALRFRTQQTTTAVGLYARGLRADHTQYLTQICLNDRPDTIAAHKSHIFIGFGNWLRVSPYNQFTGWREAEKEYFTDGGFIQQMITQRDGLVILLDNALYGITGNSWQNWSTQFLTSEKGAAGKRGAVVIGDELYFMSRDGIYAYNGSRLSKVTKHIRTDMDTEDASNCVATAWKNEAWFSYPTSGRVYVFDPDTFRQDDVGDGRVSFTKFPTYTCHQFLTYTGASDTGYFMGIKNFSATAPRIERLENDDVDLSNGATATIPFVALTKYYDFGNPHQNKTFRRLKPKVVESSTTVGGTYTLRFYRQDKFGGASYSVATITAGVGSNEYSRELALPPVQDGKTFALYVSHDAQTTAKFLGFAIEVEGRKF